MTEEAEPKGGSGGEVISWQGFVERIRTKGSFRNAALAAGAGLLVLSALAIFLALNPAGETEEEAESLTRYQQDYVDCPERYLETCTEMSRIPTEEVSFWKTENDRLYLRMEDGRAIVSTLPNETAGEFVTIMSAAEVPNSPSG